MLEKKSRTIVLLAYLALIIALVACGGDTAPVEEAPQKNLLPKKHRRPGTSRRRTDAKSAYGRGGHRSDDGSG